MPADNDKVEMSRRQALGALAATVLGTAAAIKGAELLGSAAENVEAAKELLGKAEVFYLATVDQEAVLRKGPEIPARTEPNEITRYKEEGRHRFLVVPAPTTRPHQVSTEWYAVQEIGGQARVGFVYKPELQIHFDQKLTLKKP